MDQLATHETTPESSRPINTDTGYRNWVIQSQHTASQDFDRTVLTISTGALALSAGFLNSEYAKPEIGASGLIISAWVGFGGALVASLGSLYTSNRALQTCIEQIDAETIRPETRGGFWTKLTDGLNCAALLGVLFGVLFFVLFAASNINIRRPSNANPQSAISAATPTPASSPSTDGTPR